MTTPALDVQDISSRAARVTSAEWGVVPLHEIVQLAAEDIPALLAALARVTAERDQARQVLADAQKRIAEMELDESLREEGERWAGP